MTAPTFFTVVGDFKSIIVDSLIDANIDPDYGVLTGNVTFTPMLTKGSIVRATTLSPRPTGLVPTPITGFIDADGRLKLRDSVPATKLSKSSVYDYTPVRLLADSPVLELNGVLSYAVVFSDIELDGEPANIKGFTFQAPSVDVELNLISLIGGPAGATVTPGVGGIGIAPAALRMQGTTLTMSVGGVDLPDPIDFSSFTIQHGTATGQFPSWDATLKRWVPGKDSVGKADGETLVWSVKENQWVVGGGKLDELTDVNAASRKAGGPLGDQDRLQYDVATKSWNVVPEPEFLKKLGLVNPQAGDIVIFDGNSWSNVSGYSKAELDQKLANVVSGLARKPAVQSVEDNPPTVPVVGQNFIVGSAPTGDWTGHDNEVVFWDGTHWVFSTPAKGDTHTDLTSNQSLSWNGTDWISLGSQAAALKDLQGVALGVPAKGQVLTFDGINWVSAVIPPPAAISMDALSDVESVSATDGQILVFEAATSMWKPGKNSAATALDNLTDVTVPAPTAGDVLAFDATANSWVGVQPKLANPNLGSLADVDTITAPPVSGDTLVWDETQKKWVPKVPASSIASLKDVDVKTTPPNDGHVLLWNTDQSKWLPKSLQVRNLSDVHYPLDVTTIPDRSTLVYNTTTQQWMPALAQAAVTDWDAFIDYPKGALIYHNGYFWHALRNIPKAGHASPNPEPEHVISGAHATFTHDGKQSWTQITAVERATTINQVPVTPIPAHDAGRMISNTTNYNVLMYVSDTEWVVWSLRLDTAAMAGVGPDDPLPYQWVVNPHYTATTPRSVWRNVVAPSAPAEDAACLWIYGDPTDTTVPTAPANEVDWASYPLTSYLASLADVNSSSAAPDNILVFNGKKWVAVTNPAYTKAEVDIKTSALTARIETLIHGLQHGAAVNSIAVSPPAGAEPGDLYIVGPNPAGEWAGHANKVAYLKVDRTWDLVAPAANESHLVEDQQATFSWNGTAWVKVATSATGSTAQSGVGEIIPWLADTIPADYLECKGQVVAISTYPDLYAIIGNKYNAGIADGVTTFALPDLRGYFLRGTGGSGGAANRGDKQDDSTACPKNAFTTDAAGNHFHNVGLGVFGSDANTPIVNGYNHSFLGSNRRTTANVAQDFSATLPGTNQAGQHDHRITGGGDGETRPKSVAVTWLIRWKPINGGAQGPKGQSGNDTWTVGSIQQSLLTETQFRTSLGINTDDDRKWVLADGRNVVGSKYHQVTGSDHVPDLRGAFLRMAGTNSNPSWVGGALNSFQEDSTALPKAGFNTATAGSHTHRLDRYIPKSWSDGWERLLNAVAFGFRKQGGGWEEHTTNDNGVTPAGDHTHTITGGDAETRPKSMSVNYFIKVN